MSLERTPAGPSAPDAAAEPRTLKAASNPAQRLQELLRREAQLAREAQPPTPPTETIILAETVILVEPNTPLERESNTPAEPEAAAPAPPELPPVVESHVSPETEPVTLIVVVNSERSTPTEYPSIEDLPTVASLEEQHGAFLLSDEWQRRGPALTRMIRLRRRRR